MSHPELSYTGHVRAILTLGLPLVGGHLAQFAIGLTDTIMLGWYGAEQLATLSLASSLFFTFFLVGSGFAWAVTPLVASFAAQDDQVMIRRTTRMALWLSGLFFLFSMPFLWFANPILQVLGQEPQLAEMAQTYLRIAAWGLLPALGVMTLKSYLSALERTQVILWITVLAAIVNGIGNWILIFGNLGAPELGIRGAAIASTLTQVVSLAGVVIYAHMVLPEHNLWGRFWRPDPEMFARVFHLGWPIGLTSLAEVGMFVMSALMMGWLGTIALASHGIAVQLATATFMVHLGVSNASTVRAGNAFGRGDPGHLARGAGVAFAMSVSISLVAIVIFLLMPERLVSLFLDPADPDRAAIIALGVGLLVMAALFQLVDGAQVIALGLLRGVQDTQAPMIIAGVAYWGVGLTSSYVCGFVLGWGAVGIWTGLVLGLGVAAVLLNLRFWMQALPALRTRTDAG
ncbi:MATE family efflux transporter [Mesobacterium sp. TK19101]|uniref:Multidrug-efflux transporter n=1 Tax=Mesobacterium hydrothermale TaxID=3111907 RepID=A0ABU6HD24_9RHOB|nr:MATE family efflux transporter [Mesobacterium sp. TK19101]MEC3860372.1 MATE family efflux transporter [Mesobacterium sp. TK19101]